MIGVIADDTTGANDMGTMFQRTGKSVKILSYQPKLRQDGSRKTDVLIIDTNSRLDRPEISYQKVHRATTFLNRIGCDFFFKKTASAFVGNIGAEFDAMLDALNRDFCIVVAAFPDTGRTTVEGVQYIDGVALADSEFAHDPVHPMKESRIAAIIANQTKRSVGNVYLETIRKGPKALRIAIDEKREKGVNYLVLDAENAADLECIGAAVTDYTEFAGSSVMGGYFHYPSTYPNPGVPAFERDGKGVLTVSGSLMPETHAQTQYLIENGISHLVLDSRKMLDAQERAALMKQTITRAASILKAGHDLLIMPTDDPEIVRATKLAGTQAGLDSFETSKKISSFVAQVTQQLVHQLRLHRFVIAGGDTSGAVCRSLNIQGNYVVHEIEPGIPLSLSIDGKLLFVLKSGSFGSPEFLARAIAQVKGQFD